MAKAIALVGRTDGRLLVIRRGNLLQLPEADLNGVENPLVKIATNVRLTTGYTGEEWLYLGPREAGPEEVNRYYQLRGAMRNAPVRDDQIGWVSNLAELARLAAFGHFQEWEVVQAAARHYIEHHDRG
jgi:hypothetical protein